MSDAVTLPDEDGVSVLWPSAGVGMRFTNFHDSKREGPYAELSIHNLQPDTAVPCGWSMNGLVKRGRLALLGERSQGPFVKALLVSDSKTDWGYLIESGCNRAVDAFRQPLPGVDLAEVEAPPTRPWLIPGLLPLGDPTMVYADGESGKSLLALMVSLSVCSGQPLLPGLQPRLTGPVAYLDWETNAVTHRRRLESLCRGYDMPIPRGIHYQPMHAPLSAEAAGVRALLRRLGAKLVVVDSMGFAAEGDVMGPDGALGVFRALRGWDGTVLALHHMSKEEAAKEYGAAQAYGSIYFRNSVRCSWEMRALQAPGGVRRLALYHRKDNDGDRTGPPIGLELHWNQETQKTTVGTFRVSGDSVLAAHGGLGFMLLGILRQHGGKTPSQLEAMTGHPADKLADTMRHDARFVALIPGGGRGKETVWGAAQ